MLDFKRCHDPKTNEIYIETSIEGQFLLTTPQLNKGTAFTEQERQAFGLLGKLPVRVETLEEQTNRVYQQYKAFQDPLQRNIFLHNIHHINQILFYSLLSRHLEEMLPTIYTPIVASAVQSYSREYRRSRGLYLPYTQQDRLEEMLDNRSHGQLDLIVVTDGEGVLGIGDQGIGGMDIPVAKLMVYTLCGGIDPTRTLPIQLDVGTNNETLLADPLYLGLREPRISRKKYDEFIDHFVTVIKKKFPYIFLHWEDLGKNNARRVLDCYKDKVCNFNDDIEGTGAVTLAAILAGIKHKKERLSDQRIIIFGAGTAGTGIADQVRDAMIKEGTSREKACQQFWLLDRSGLICKDTTTLNSSQEPYVRDRSELTTWQLSQTGTANLLEVVTNIKPTILIGCSAQAGAFSEAIIRQMAEHVAQPIILPLSNPTEKIEATPSQLMEWTNGKALIATGSPFEPVNFKGTQKVIAQCNNALIFPGLGLGLITVKAKHLTDSMLWVTSKTLAEYAPINKNSEAPLLPGKSMARKIAHLIGVAVARLAIEEGHATLHIPLEQLDSAITKNMWKPEYLPYRKKQ